MQAQYQPLMGIMASSEDTSPGLLTVGKIRQYPTYILTEYLQYIC